MSKKNNLGFSLLEILMAIAVGVLLLALGSNVFFNLSNKQSLEKDVNTSLSFIEKARMQTINSLNLQEYGVNFSTSSVTIFPGQIYSPQNASNTVYNLGSRAEISSINLSNGENYFYFKKITGGVSATGTIIFSGSDPSLTKQITVSATGLSESN